MIEKKVIFVDIDETICFYDGVERRYKNAIPNYENINKINKFYEEGNHIKYWTGRGAVSKIDYYDLTKKQLSEWGAKYHELKADKPYYDLFVEDKSLRIEEL